MGTVWGPAHNISWPRTFVHFVMNERVFGGDLMIINTKRCFIMSWGNAWLWTLEILNDAENWIPILLKVTSPTIVWTFKLNPREINISASNKLCFINLPVGNINHIRRCVLLIRGLCQPHFRPRNSWAEISICEERDNGKQTSRVRGQQQRQGLVTRDTEACTGDKPLLLMLHKHFFSVKWVIRRRTVSRY